MATLPRKTLRVDVAPEMHETLTLLASKLDVSIAAVVRECIEWAMAENFKANRKEDDPNAPHVPAAIQQALPQHRGGRLVMPRGRTFASMGPSSGPPPGGPLG